MPNMTEEQREAFLATPRLGILTTLRDDGSPIAVPVWFEWDGAVARVFSGATSLKIRRLRRDARASLLVTNAMGEHESWVAFDGTVEISTDGAFALAERLAGRYWDMTTDEHRSAFEGWRKTAEHLRLLTLTPSDIRAWRD